MSADFWIFALAIGITAIVMVPVMRWSMSTMREANRLADEGWICVDCYLFTGPVMVPPEAVMSELEAAQWREHMKAKKEARR